MTLVKAEKIFVDREAVAAAWAIIYDYHVIRGLKTKRAHVKRRPPRDVDAMGIVDRVHYYLSDLVEMQAGPVEKAARELVREQAKQHKYIRYALQLPGIGELAAIAFIASPPEVTLKTNGPVVPPTSYISVHFIPVKLRDGRIHRNVLSRYFFATVQTLRFRLKEILSRFAPLARIYERSLKRYGGNARAKRLAFRDVVRVMIGCVWLVRMLELIDRGLVEPSEVMLPHPEMLKDIESGSGVDPWMIIPYPAANEYKRYTWQRLLSLVKP